MALNDIAANLTGGTPHQTCGTCHALTTMTTGEAATLRSLLADRTVKFRALADALEADPDTPTVDWQALSRHARGLCSAREKLR